MNGAEGNSGFGWMLVIVGLVIAGIGLIWVLAPNLPRLGRLPGDIVIERENVSPLSRRALGFDTPREFVAAG